MSNYTGLYSVNTANYPKVDVSCFTCFYGLENIKSIYVNSVTGQGNGSLSELNIDRVRPMNRDTRVGFTSNDSQIELFSFTLNYSSGSSAPTGYDTFDRVKVEFTVYWNTDVETFDRYTEYIDIRNTNGISDTNGHVTKDTSDFIDLTNIQISFNRSMDYSEFRAGDVVYFKFDCAKRNYTALNYVMIRSEKNGEIATKNLLTEWGNPTIAGSYVLTETDIKSGSISDTFTITARDTTKSNYAIGTIRFSVPFLTLKDVDLFVSTTLSDRPSAIGAEATYTVTITNNGSSELSGAKYYTLFDAKNEQPIAWTYIDTIPAGEKLEIPISVLTSEAVKKAVKGIFIMDLGNDLQSVKKEAEGYFLFRDTIDVDFTEHNFPAGATYCAGNTITISTKVRNSSSWDYGSEEGSGISTSLRPGRVFKPSGSWHSADMDYTYTITDDDDRRGYLWARVRFAAKLTLGDKLIPIYKERLYTKKLAYPERIDSRYGRGTGPKITKDTDTGNRISFVSDNREFKIAAKLKFANNLQDEFGYTDRDNDPATMTLSVMTTDDIIDYAYNQSVSSSGLSFGGTESASFSLTLKEESAFKVRDYMNIGMRLAMYVFIGYRNADTPGTGDDSEYEWKAFGAWLVQSADYDEQGTSFTVSGSDSLSIDALSFKLNNDRTKYPIAMEDFVRNMINSKRPEMFCYFKGIIGLPFITQWDYIPIKPETDWEGSATTRDILKYIAEVWGGFAFVDRKGHMYIKSFARGSKHRINPDQYYSFSKDSNAEVSIRYWWVATDNGYELRRMRTFGEDEEWYEVLFYDQAYTAETIWTDKNPVIEAVKTNWLLNTNLAISVFETVIENLNDYTWREPDKNIPLVSGNLEWMGDPCVEPGDVVDITNVDGTSSRIVVLSINHSFNQGGLSCSISGTLDDPGAIAPKGEYYFDIM